MNVVVLPALDPNKKEEPLFDLAGGTGAASTEGAPFYAGKGREYRRHRDVVLADQRGTGESNGLKPAPRPKTPQDFLTEMYPMDYVKRLRQTDTQAEPSPLRASACQRKRPRLSRSLETEKSCLHLGPSDVKPSELLFNSNA